MDSNPKTFFHPRHLGEPRDNIAALDRNSCHSRPPVVPDPPLSCSPISNAVPSTNQENTATSTPNLATPTLVRCGGTTLKGGRCRREKILSSVGTNVEWFCFDHVTQASGYDPTNKATSTSPTPAVIRCGGTTKKGVRCLRKKKLSAVDSQAEWFCCPKHGTQAAGDYPTNKATSTLTNKTNATPPTRTVRQAHNQLGYHARNGEWVEFDIWIPDHLQPATQATLQKEMQKELSSSDKPGYLYVCEIRDPKAPATREMLMKVGYEKNLTERTRYWTRHYSSCDLRFPLDVLNRDETTMVPFRKRLERLVLIELADLVQHSAYLDPQYPKAGKAPAPCAKKPKRSCIVRDCAVIHKEVFPFMRFSRKRDVDKIIGDIILRWSEFCKTCY